MFSSENRSNSCSKLLYGNGSYKRHSFKRLASGMLSNTAATSYMWLLNIWSMTSATEELNFILFELKWKKWYLTQLLKNFVVYLEQREYEYLEHFEYGTTINVTKSKHRSRISDEKLISELQCALSVKCTVWERECNILKSFYIYYMLKWNYFRYIGSNKRLLKLVSLSSFYFFKYGY